MTPARAWTCTGVGLLMHAALIGTAIHRYMRSRFMNDMNKPEPYTVKEIRTRIHTAVTRYVARGANLASAINLVASDYNIERAKVERMFQQQGQLAMEAKLAEIAERQRQEVES